MSQQERPDVSTRGTRCLDKRDPMSRQERPDVSTRETRCLDKRDPMSRQERPDVSTRETRCLDKRDPMSRQEAPDVSTRETRCLDKRDPMSRQEAPDVSTRDTRCLDKRHPMSRQERPDVSTTRDTRCFDKRHPMPFYCQCRKVTYSVVDGYFWIAVLQYNVNRSILLQDDRYFWCHGRCKCVGFHADPRNSSPQTPPNVFINWPTKTTFFWKKALQMNQTSKDIAVDYVVIHVEYV